MAEDGQLWYYGATSNLHILENELSSMLRALHRSIRFEGGESLARAGLNQRIDPDLEKHLEDLCFRWEDPAIHVVDEEVSSQRVRTTREKMETRFTPKH